MPKRIQMSRQHPWRADNPDAVRVDRGPGRKHGNPFEIGTWATMLDVEGGPIDIEVKDRATAVSLFRSWINGRRYLDIPNPPPLIEIVEALHGSDLACWCPLDEPCHADVLLEVANQ